jgi:hypothetical protein
VSDIITSHPLQPITMKGISREVVPYAVDSVIDAKPEQSDIVVERMPGLDFYLDPSAVRPDDAERLRSVLNEALASLDRKV